MFICVAAGLLHDIGKLGVPDKVLLKPGPLDEEEWKVMRMHPQFAHDWLVPIPYLRKAVADPACGRMSIGLREDSSGTSLVASPTPRPIPGVDAVGLSTNGTRLTTLARPLREAGVRSVNISLDALDSTLYRRITGGDVATVLAGIRAAVEAGFERVKLNAVLLRGLNEGELWPLVLFAAEHRLPLRFIELMPVSRTDVLTDANLLPVTEVMTQLRAREHLIPQPDHRLGHGPAKYYRLLPLRAARG